MHLSEAALTGTTHGEVQLAHLENHHRSVLADQVRTWCANPDAQVTVKPVIDLDEHLRVDQYDVPDRLREQTILRDRTCVFPWCTRPARTSDIDHVVPFDKAARPRPTTSHPCVADITDSKPIRPGPTPVIEPGTYLWSSPHGYQFLRNTTGRPTSLVIESDRQPWLRRTAEEQFESSRWTC